MDIFNLSQESLWLLTVVYDLGLALLLYRFFGKYGLYVAVVLGIVLGNLQGGKVSELIIFGTAYKVSMGAILYSGIYFATDVLKDDYDVLRKSADSPFPVRKSDDVFLQTIWAMHCQTSVKVPVQL